MIIKNQADWETYKSRFNGEHYTAEHIILRADDTLDVLDVLPSYPVFLLSVESIELDVNDNVVSNIITHYVFDISLAEQLIAAVNKDFTLE